VRALVLGARGMLGRDLVAAAPAGVRLFTTPVGFDITDEEALAGELDAHQPDVVLNAAAYTRVDQAEMEEDRAVEVNGRAVGVLGTRCAERSIRVVQFSTDYVFSGEGRAPYREEDPPRPLNAYGRSKLVGERELSESGAESLILRTQWLFGHHGRSFPRTMLERAAAGEQTRVVDDQTGCPTYTADLAEAVWELVSGGDTGILHVVNAGKASWYEVAMEIFERAGRADLLTRCTSADFPTTARRPGYSVLDGTRARARLGRELPHWRDAIDRFLRSATHLPAPGR
jgi:dTDP-4-dehydrorhamnose reductase